MMMVAYIAVTEEAVNALNQSDVPRFCQAGFSGEVYVGIIANTPRLETCVEYLTYLVSGNNQ